MPGNDVLRFKGKHITDEQLQHLHDQMTRGYQPTLEEQSKLDAWYMRQASAVRSEASEFCL